MSTDMEQVVRELAVIAAARQVLAERETELKAQVSIPKGTVWASVDGSNDDDKLLGNVQAKRRARPAPRIVHEDQTVAWAVGQFGESAMDVRLSETGRRDVVAAVKKGQVVPGVEWPDAPAGTSIAFTPSKNVLALVRGMASAGELPTLAPLFTMEVAQ